MLFWNLFFFLVIFGCLFFLVIFGLVLFYRLGRFNHCINSLRVIFKAFLRMIEFQKILQQSFFYN